MKKAVYILFFLALAFRSVAMEIELTELADVQQVYGLQIDSETLLPMNDLNIEFGYVLYQADIVTEIEDATLEVENVRDFASVYVDDVFLGTITDDNKKICLLVKPGKHVLKLYVENIGRITYGPEILDNSKGLFGNINIDGKDITDWTITELKVRNSDVTNFTYSADSLKVPGFHKGYFSIEAERDIYLDITGWGMGEAWINGEYIGSFWEAEKQKSIRIPLALLKKENNEVVIFELENNEQKYVKLSSQPVFK